MDEWYMWQVFFTTGSVLDYIRYKSIQDAKDTGADTVGEERRNEISDRGTDYQRAEFR